MGCGKSTIGWGLANELGYQFVDSDEAIEQSEGLSVSEIFAQKGEAYFRQKEMEFLESGHLLEGQVVSCGGGILTEAGRMEWMEKHGFLVCLYASADEVWRRVKGSKSRPLLTTENPRETLQVLYDERMPIYQKISTIIMTENRPIRDIICHIKREYLSRVKP